MVSPTHDIDTTWLNAHQAIVRLRDENTIPNKDFTLQESVLWETAPVRAAL